MQSLHLQSLGLTSPFRVINQVLEGLQVLHASLDTKPYVPKLFFSHLFLYPLESFPIGLLMCDSTLEVPHFLEFHDSVCIEGRLIIVIHTLQ